VHNSASNALATPILQAQGCFQRLEQLGSLGLIWKRVTDGRSGDSTTECVALSLGHTVTIVATNGPRLTVDRRSGQIGNVYDHSTTTSRIPTNSVRFGSRFITVSPRCVTIYYDLVRIYRVVPRTRYECRRRTTITYDYSRFTHVLLTSVLRCTTISHGGPTNNHDFARFHAIQRDSGTQRTRGQLFSH